jgi:hypothetical protein
MSEPVLECLPEEMKHESLSWTEFWYCPLRHKVG